MRASPVRALLGFCLLGALPALGADGPDLLRCRSLYSFRPGDYRVEIAMAGVRNNHSALEVAHCRGNVSWGCRSGMDEYLHLTVPVITEDGSSFRGSNGSALPDSEGGYDVKVGEFSHHFLPVECDHPFENGLKG
jgi:hypothetical protein